MFRPQTQRSPARLARALLAVFVVVWIGPLVHELTSVHVVCVEHASLCHDDDAGPLDAGHDDQRAPGWQSLDELPDTEGDDHGPCQVALARSGRALVPASDVAGVDQGWMPSEPAVLAAAAACTVALLRLAPKTSPPQVA